MAKNWLEFLASGWEAFTAADWAAMLPAPVIHLAMHHGHLILKDGKLSCSCCPKDCYYYWSCTWTCSGDSGSWSGVSGASHECDTPPTAPVNPITMLPVTLGAWQLYSKVASGGYSSSCTYRFYIKGGVCNTGDDCTGLGVTAPTSCPSSHTDCDCPPPCTSCPVCSDRVANCASTYTLVASGFTGDCCSGGNGTWTLSQTVPGDGDYGRDCPWVSDTWECDDETLFPRWTVTCAPVTCGGVLSQNWLVDIELCFDSGCTAIDAAIGLYYKHVNSCCPIGTYLQCTDSDGGGGCLTGGLITIS